MEKIEEPGVLWRDGIHFWTASSYAKAHLMYPMWGATYNLDVPYRIRRDYMDAYMIQYIVSGSLHFKLRGKEFVAHAGEIVLLACREANDYWSEEPGRVKWFHFNGKGVSELLEYIYEKNGSGHMSRFFGSQTLRYVDAILAGLKSGEISDFEFSRNIYALLCTLAEEDPSERETAAEEAVRLSVNYIREHYAEPLSVARLAQSVNLSQYYFTRQFKKIMLTSPHSYLLNYRLDRAKKMLVYTDEKIDAIAEQTGFLSSSYFVRAFHREMNMTPKAFRNYISNVRGKNKQKKESSE